MKKQDEKTTEENLLIENSKYDGYGISSSLELIRLNKIGLTAGNI